MQARFKASLDALPEMMQFVTSAMKQTKASGKQINQVEVSLEEALVNVISYAYEGKAGELEIACTEENPDGIKIQIKDWGVAFDPTAKAVNINKDASLEERKIGGLGLFFMYQLMDHVSYKREDEANVLTLVKKFSSQT